MMENLKEKALDLHKEIQGKISTELKTKLENKDDLSLVYSPGVAEPCKKIHENEDDAYVYTGKANTIAVISDGTAVLGLGNIGPKAALPVMEGKACLFKKFGGLNAVPLVIDTTDTEEIIKFVKQVSPTFGGVNLEDISSPRCIEIETRLKEELDIPVFHDDQHGTAIVTIAALINSLKLVNKKPEECNVVISGVGAAGSSIVRMLNDFGINDIYAFNSRGILREDEKYSKDLYNKLAKETNKENKNLTLEEAMADADIFVGVSVPNKVTKEMVKSMRRDPIVLAMANPECLMLTNNVWFVKCYLGMFIMAPILNAFVEKTDKRTFSTVLLSFFIFQTIYGWFSNGAPYFEKGYSAFSFMGLYLLARYVRIYQPSYTQWSKSKNLLMYISLSTFTALMLIITCYFDKVGYFCMFWTYTSPLVIAGALYLLLFFNRFAFQNKGINWIAASCFAVYLFHFFIWEYFMKPHIQQLAVTYNGISCLLVITGLLSTFFTAAILIDKIRLYIWNHFVSKYIS